MYDHTFSKLANHHIRHQATHTMGCELGDCIYFNIPQGSVWVCMDLHTHFVNKERRPDCENEKVTGEWW